MKRSTTIILPQWFQTLKELDLEERMMPRDVAMHWNSTYDMLKFALDYHPALDLITGDHNMKLRQYELDLEEWGIAIGQASM